MTVLALAALLLPSRTLTPGRRQLSYLEEGSWLVLRFNVPSASLRAELIVASQAVWHEELDELDVFVNPPVAAHSLVLRAARERLAAVCGCAALGPAGEAVAAPHPRAGVGAGDSSAGAARRINLPPRRGSRRYGMYVFIM